jgi:tetratricopeptide (TPR) repeat protein
MYLWANAFTAHSFLSDTAIQKMFTPHIIEEGMNGHYSFGYGCNVSKSRRNTKVIDNGGSNGIYFARMLRLPEEGLVFYMVTNESAINTNNVLPNVTQLYFQGKITDDALTSKSKFETPLAEDIYKIIVDKKPADLGQELQKAGIRVDDDMILLNVGQNLIDEKKTDEALTLYKFYTKEFPDIVVAWNDLGDAYQMKSNKEEAIKCYQQALKLRPNNPRAKENLDKLGK